MTKYCVHKFQALVNIPEHTNAGAHVHIIALRSILLLFSGHLRPDLTSVLFSLGFSEKYCIYTFIILCYMP